MNYRENVRVAMQSIKSNRLRTMLTALIIAIGITALVGILTSLDAVEKSMTDAFSSMGANSFTIRNRGIGIRVNGSGQAPKQYKSITYDDAAKFKASFNGPATPSVSVTASFNSTAKYNNIKSDPNVPLLGIDENGLSAQGNTLSAGRSFSQTELDLGSNVAIIGTELKEKLFKNEDPLDKMISVGNNRFKVVGVLGKKGSSSSSRDNRTVFVPLLRSKQLIVIANPSYTIAVMVKSPDQMENVIGEATALFRNIRKRKVIEENNFEITKSDAIAQTFISNLSMIKYAGIAIGAITLIGASIGLMNIMLVSVTERTREIGIRKAIGATPSIIRKQFLIEAIVICLLGGAMGVFLGIVIGNLISLSMDGAFIIPWVWMFMGLALCVAVGIFAGFYPASKASKLDPVEALRYE